MQGNQNKKAACHSYVITASQISPFIGNVEEIFNLIWSCFISVQKAKKSYG
jgi:hypothetical protein